MKRSFMVKKHYFITFIVLAIFSFLLHEVHASEPTKEQIDEEYTLRQVLYEQMSVLTGIPWYDLAAIDQYERSMTIANPKENRIIPGVLGIHIDAARWAGTFNPDPEDVEPTSIAWFGGIGRDGNGDGKADRHDEVDVLYSLSIHLLSYGISSEDFSNALWEYYRNPRSVQRIEQLSKVYATMQTIKLDERVFPLPLHARYTYRNTWGAARGWGGRRIHEGTDIFASYGTPVFSTSHGVIELIGWNKYGGWRVGIRDIQNVYHYYAHLQGFNKDLKKGDVVKPGDTIGYVGSSGYGKPGTSGKFPPHLHYGLYRDSGITEWSFNPYPYLVRWESQTRKKSR